MKPWPQLSIAQQQITLLAMATFGGSFASRLAEAWKAADPINAARLAHAFPELIERYGPGSEAYAMAEQMEQPR